MKTYRIKSLIGAAVACLALSSCGDFLNIEPKTFVSEDNFWNEKTDIDQMVTGIYTKMQSDAYIRRCIIWGETRSDNIGEGNNCSGQTDIYRTLREYLLSTNQFTNWQPFYAVINQCNIIIARAPEVSEKDPVYTQSDVLATQAEASFLRALSYFYLVRAFKDVPFYFNPIQSDDDADPIGVTDGDVIVRTLIADLESVVSNALKAYPKDNSRNYNSNCNRVTQNAIYALLADLCLWDNQYQKCIDYAQKVIDAKYAEYEEEYSRGISLTTGDPTIYKWTNDTWSKGYPLYPCFSGSNDFGNDFNSIFGTGNSFESIFELSFNYTGAGSNYIANTACADLYGNWYTTKGNDGQGFLAVDEKVAADMTNTEQTVFSSKYDCRFYTNLNTGHGSSTSSVTTTYPAKYVESSRYITAVQGSSTIPFKVDVWGMSTYANRNWIFYRLTDVMLMQAEALIESAKYADYSPKTVDENGASVPLLDADGNPVVEENLAKAFALLWTVNRRSIMVNSTTAEAGPNYQLKWVLNTQNQSALRTMCLAERRRELMFEGKRWFDLLRYCHREGKVDYIKNAVPAKSGGSVPVAYEALFWPYNKQEVKNNSALTQKAYYGEDDTEGNYSSTK